MATMQARRSTRTLLFDLAKKIEDGAITAPFDQPANLVRAYDLPVRLDLHSYDGSGIPTRRVISLDIHQTGTGSWIVYALDIAGPGVGRNVGTHITSGSLPGLLRKIALEGAYDPDEVS